MTFISEFSDLMNDTVIHEPLTGRDEFSKPTYGTAVSYKARVSYTHKKVASGRQGAQGQDVLSTCQVIFADVVTIHMDDRVTLPDGSTPLIQSWETTSDEKENIYTKVYFG